MLIDTGKLKLTGPRTLARKLRYEALSALGIFPKNNDSNKHRNTEGGNMKIKSLLSSALLLCSLIAVLNTSVTARAIQAQDKNSKAKVPEAELKAAKAVEAAPDASAKLAAAEEFLKKYPKSSNRFQMAEYLVDQILGVKDPSQKLALAQKFPAVFTEPGEGNLVKPALLDAYVQLKRLDEAFTDGGSYLATNGDDIQVLFLLAITGTEEAKKRNPKYVNESRQYGLKAIELIEGDKKPAKMEDAFWAKQKAGLPQLYQEMAIISLIDGNAAEALVKLEKSVKLNPADPFNYVMLGSITNDDYQNVAQTFKNMPDGKAKEDLFQKANALLDKVIDQYAHAVALSEGKPQYQALHDQVLGDLSTYYSYRHNKSTAGMQKLIDGYKLP
jgi:hypothetical protein